MKKKLTMVAALVLVFALGVTGTLAYLTASTESLVNTFTVGKVAIALNETKTDFKMVPGNTIDKDPKVTVKKDSEACYLFVKVEKSSNLDNFITFGMADGWTALDGATGVYYREVSATTADTDFDVLKDNKVTVKSEVTTAAMEALTEETQPTLTFTAYAAQQANLTVYQAWKEFDSSYTIPTVSE